MITGSRDKNGEVSSSRVSPSSRTPPPPSSETDGSMSMSTEALSKVKFGPAFASLRAVVSNGRITSFSDSGATDALSAAPLQTLSIEEINQCVNACGIEEGDALSNATLRLLLGTLAHDFDLLHIGVCAGVVMRIGTFSDVYDYLDELGIEILRHSLYIPVNRKAQDPMIF